MNKKENNLSTEKPSLNFPLLLLGMFIICLIWLGTPILVSKWAHSSSQEICGQFGDTFGTINSLFSGFAFITLIFTLHLQIREFWLQRLEFIENRKALLDQEKQLERSANIQIVANKLKVMELNFLYNLEQFKNAKERGNEETMRKCAKNLNKISNDMESITTDIYNYH